jgi:hypothetical protein
MVYPTELVEKAKYEIEIFERVSADTGQELLDEVIRLREMSLETALQVVAEHQRQVDLDTFD